MNGRYFAFFFSIFFSKKHFVYAFNIVPIFCFFLKKSIHITDCARCDLLLVCASFSDFATPNFFFPFFIHSFLLSFFLPFSFAVDFFLLSFVEYIDPIRSWRTPVVFRKVWTRSSRRRSLTRLRTTSRCSTVTVTVLCAH